MASQVQGASGCSDLVGGHLGPGWERATETGRLTLAWESWASACLGLGSDGAVCQGPLSN